MGRPRSIPRSPCCDRGSEARRSRPGQSITDRQNVPDHAAVGAGRPTNGPIAVDGEFALLEQGYLEVIGQYHSTRKMRFLLTGEVPEGASESVYGNGEHIV